MKKNCKKNIELDSYTRYHHIFTGAVGIVNDDSKLVKHLNKILELAEVMRQVTFELENEIIDFCNLLNGDNLDEVTLDNFKKKDAKNIYSQELLEKIAEKMKFIILDLMDRTGLIKASMIDSLEEKYDYLTSTCLED